MQFLDKLKNFTSSVPTLQKGIELFSARFKSNTTTQKKKAHAAKGVAGVLPSPPLPTLTLSANSTQHSSRSTTGSSREATTSHSPNVAIKRNKSRATNSQASSSNESSTIVTATQLSAPVFDFSDLVDNSQKNLHDSSNSGSNIASIICDDVDVYIDRETLYNVENDLLDLIGAKFASKYKLLPLQRQDNTVTMACAGKSELAMIERLLKEKHRHLKFKFIITTEDLLTPAIDWHYLRHETQNQANERLKGLSEKLSELTTTNQTKHLIFSDSKPTSGPDAAIADLIEHILCQAHGSKAQDLIIYFDNALGEQSKGTMYCEARIHKRCRTIFMRPDIELQHFRRFPHVLKIMSHKDPNNERDEQSGVIQAYLSYATRHTAVQFRVNFLPTGDKTGESIAVRIQDKSHFTFTIDNVGLLPFQKQLLIKEILTTTSGVITCLGKIGCGKNTLLVCMVASIQELQPGVIIISIEDPPEIHMKRVIQVKVETSLQDAKGKKRGFQYYLKPVLRHAPDIIIVGEVREPETAQMVTEAGGIGHLMLTTMHADDVFEGINRYRNMGVENYRIAAALNTLIAQRLVVANCPDCEKIPDEVPADFPNLDAVIKAIDWQEEVRFVKGSGKTANGKTCQTCEGSGLYGLTGIYEILVVDTDIRNLVSRGADVEEIRTEAFKKGFRSLWSVGVEKALRGETTLAQVYKELKGMPLDQY